MLPEVIARSVVGSPPQPSRDFPYMNTARTQLISDSSDASTDYKQIDLFMWNLCKMLRKGIS